jgi:hypothetical protein
MTSTVLLYNSGNWNIYSENGGRMKKHVSFIPVNVEWMTHLEIQEIITGERCIIITFASHRSPERDRVICDMESRGINVGDINDLHRILHVSSIMQCQRLAEFLTQNVTFYNEFHMAFLQMFLNQVKDNPQTEGKVVMTRYHVSLQDILNRGMAINHILEFKPADKTSWMQHLSFIWNPQGRHFISMKIKDDRYDEIIRVLNQTYKLGFTKDDDPVLYSLNQLTTGSIKKLKIIAKFLKDHIVFDDEKYTTVLDRFT